MISAVTPVFARDALDELYDKLQRDFDSKPHFFNKSINDFRDGIESPFIKPYFKEYAANNARPLTPTQISKLPEGYFLEKEPFFLAMAGRERLLKAGKIKNHPILAVVDFSRHARNRRLFIMDIHKGEVLINTYTSHAAKTDSDRDGYADTFSNQAGSNLSSLGFMSSDVTYSGNYGYSLRMRGHDPLLNSNVFSRAVVVHGFGGLGPHDASWGSMSTSEGCLMISTNESGRFWGMEDKSMLDLVIKTLKPGSLIFTYDYENPELFKSTWIKKSDIPEVVVEEEPVPEDPKPEEPKPEEPKPQDPEVGKPAQPVEVEPVNEYNEEEVVVSHLPGRSKILPARPAN